MQVHVKVEMLIVESGVNSRGTRHVIDTIMCVRSSQFTSLKSHTNTCTHEYIHMRILALAFT